MIYVFVTNAVFRYQRLQTCTHSRLGKLQFSHIFLIEPDTAVLFRKEQPVFKIRILHQSGFIHDLFFFQFIYRINHSRSADSPRLFITDRLQFYIFSIELDLADRPRDTAGSAHDIAALKCRSCRCGSHHDTVFTSDRHLAVSAEIHQHARLLSLIKIQGIHSGRDITAHIGGYSRTDHNIKILLLCPEQFSARCMGKRDVHRRKRIYSECFTGISHEKMDHRGIAVPPILGSG